MSGFDSAVHDEEQRMDEQMAEEEMAYWFEMFCREQSQADMPAHKQDGYAEKIAELADELRKQKKENLQ